jgi:hypothetical protein
VYIQLKIYKFKEKNIIIIYIIYKQ